MINLNHTWLDIECPKCGYQDHIQMIDIKTERTILCHNCKVSIKLIDGDASAHQSIEKINSSIKELERLFKNFGK